MLSRRDYLERMYAVASSRRSNARHAGFTLFELIIVIVLVASMSGILVERFLGYQEMAEKAAMEQTAGAIRSALNMQVAGLITRGNMEDISRLAAVNPFNLLTEKQRNYVGEYYDSKPEDIPPGSWYFDLKQKQLVYIVHRGAHFVADQEGNKSVRYRVSPVYNDLFQKKLNNSGEKEIGGVTLEEVEPYVWAIK